PSGGRRHRRAPRDWSVVTVVMGDTVISRVLGRSLLYVVRYVRFVRFVRVVRDNRRQECSRSGEVTPTPGAPEPAWQPTEQPRAPRPPALPVYLAPPDVAAALKISLKSLYRLVESNSTMPVLRLGTGRNASLRFPAARLARWLQDRESGRRSA